MRRLPAPRRCVGRHRIAPRALPEPALPRSGADRRSAPGVHGRRRRSRASCPRRRLRTTPTSARCAARPRRRASACAWPCAWARSRRTGRACPCTCRRRRRPGRRPSSATAQPRAPPATLLASRSLNSPNRHRLACSGAGARRARARARCRCRSENPPAPSGRREEPHVEFHRAGALLCAAPLVLLSIPASAVVDGERARGGEGRSSPPPSRRSPPRSTPSRRSSAGSISSSRAAPAAAPAPSGPRIPPVNADNPAISFVVDTTGAVRHPRLGLELRAAQRRALHLGADRSLPARLRHDQRLERGGLRHRGGGGRHHGAALEPDRRRAAASSPTSGACRTGTTRRCPSSNRPPSIDRLIGGEIPGRGRRGHLARADRALHPADERRLQHDRRRAQRGAARRWASTGAATSAS